MNKNFYAEARQIYFSTNINSIADVSSLEVRNALYQVARRDKYKRVFKVRNLKAKRIL